MTDVKRAVLALLFLGLFSSFIPAAVVADVTVERHVKTGGFKGVGASESTTVEKISGLSRRSTTATEMKGKLGGLLGKFAGDLGRDEIVLVGEDRVIHLNHKKKTFSENPITLPREDSNPGAERGGRDDAPPGEDEGEKRNIKIIRNEITVEETGEDKTIGGFPCSRYLVTWVLEVEDLDSGAKTMSTMTSELWNTPETAATRALQKEEILFNVAYMRKMGVHIPPQKMKRFGLLAIAAMLGSNRDEMEEKMKELEKKFSGIEGFSVATAVTWRSSSEGGPVDEEEESPGLSEGIGGLFAGFAKKAMKKKTAPDREESAADSVVFDSYTEVRKIDLSPVNLSDFEVPAGYSRE